MPVVFVDPRPQAATESDAYTARLDWRRDQPPVVGLLANGFPDSEAFLAAVADALVPLVPGVTFRAVTKLSPPVPLTDEQLAMLTDECDAIVAAYGH